MKKLLIDRERKHPPTALKMGPIMYDADTFQIINVPIRKSMFPIATSPN